MHLETVFIWLCFAGLVGLALTVILPPIDWQKVSQAYAKLSAQEDSEP
ncbi:MAG: hypothetical protein MUF19_04295 [Candidatus Pacebacteria bacterium]|jgi:hypothetical protein|nr:hypothetical protein [Candidatus Paceibacterota bacterium]